MRHVTIALSILLLCATGAAHAECVAQSAPTRAHLVELFTSEGCSSCPPADAWLRGLHADANVVPLEWHVDYWDALGWPDRFDDARYTARQRELGARTAQHIVYTPEVALDGREWRGWSPRPARIHAAARARAIAFACDPRHTAAGGFEQHAASRQLARLLRSDRG